MPAKQGQRAEINTFVRGIITEASPLNFPPDASADEENFELNRDGTRNRRLGFDLENGYTTYATNIPTTELPNTAVSTFKWIEVAGNVQTELVVVQCNNQLHFFDTSQDVLSTAGARGLIVLDEFPAGIKYSFTSVEGLLVVAAGVETIAIITFDDPGFSVEYDRLLIRDVFGVEEENPDAERDISFRGTYTKTHHYNLQNQSWGIPRKARTVGDTIEFVDPVRMYDYYYEVSPSSGEQVWTGLQFQPVQAEEEPYERMWLNLYAESLGTEISAAKGYFIIDALKRGQSRQEAVWRNHAKHPVLFDPPAGVEGLVHYEDDFLLREDYTPNGASCVAEFAGRVFYSGFEGGVINGDRRSPNYSNYVFFSQLVKNRGDLVKCYQEGDPTSREGSELVDTDGGFLRVSEAKQIVALVNLGSNLIVLATNGIWSIDGGSDYGFVATNYKVTKISTFGAISASSITIEGDQIFYWAEEAIYVIGRSQIGDLQVQSLTITTIQSFYDDISLEAKKNAVGLFDQVNNKVRWLYTEGISISPDSITKELVFDTTLGAFYLHKIYNHTPHVGFVKSVFSTSPFRTGTVDSQVLHLEDEVFSDLEEVVIRQQFKVDGFSAAKYLVMMDVNGNLHITFGHYRDPLFRDWQSVNNTGVDAKAFCLTGSQTAGDSSIEKQVPYIVFHMENTDKESDINGGSLTPSGCLIRSQWNFADSANSNKWSPPQQVYRHRRPFLASEPFGSVYNGLEVVTTKTKLRGRGRAFALHFETEPLKDCKVLGWSLTVNGNSTA